MYALAGPLFPQDGAYTTARSFTLPFNTLSSMAVNCADNMYAMFVAFAPSSQFLRLVLPVPIAVAFGYGHPDTGSKSVPLAFLRYRPFSQQSCAPVIIACPFLLDQKPNVKPPPAPKQTLPKSLPSALGPTPMPVMLVGVVGSQTGGSDGMASQTAYVPSSSPVK